MSSPSLLSKAPSSNTSSSSFPSPLPPPSADVFSSPSIIRQSTHPASIQPRSTSSNPLQEPPDPLDSLARSKTPFFLAINEEPSTPSRYSHTTKHLDLTPESPLNPLNEGISGTTAWSFGGGGARGGGLGLQSLWTSPGGVQGSMAATSKMDSGTAAEWRAAFANLSDPSLDLSTRMVQLIGMLSSLHVRVSTLERDNTVQEEEIRQLRCLIRSQARGSPGADSSNNTSPRAGTPPYSFPFYQQPNTTRLQAHARPFDPTPAHTRTPSSSAFPSPTNFSSSASIPHSQSFPGYSPTDSLSYSHGHSPCPATPYTSPYGDAVELDSPSALLMARRRSRAGSEMVTRRRDRVASMSATAPLMAQAQWMAKQQGSPQEIMPRINSLPLQPLEPINYRALLEHDTDINDEAFVMRVVTQNDQQCSLFLQQRVRSTTTEARRLAIFNAVGNHLHALCVSKFGNFLVSRCLENGGPELAQAYTRALVGHFLTLSLDPFGCHVTQKLLDCGDQTTKNHVVEELIAHSATLTEKHSLHVWNRLLTTPNPPRFYEQLAATGKGLWAEVAKDEGGSLVIQRICEDWSEAHTSNIAEEIFEGVEQVATSSCGSFVLTHFMERNALPFRARILELGPIIALDGFGAKVIEKSLRSGRVASGGVSEFIEAIVKVPAEPGRLPVIVDIASHGNGSQLLSILLTISVTTFGDKNMLVKAITKHASILKQTPHGQKVVALCERPRP
ncbi:armadillo-type protein [Leucosporidium creatinivorum]|uniref:Armadillo-type protein n=1 Tax=Leucosporidium creatinivorum TaxID=106004 RepID=A0A1Y2DDS4_9BASI|nr:armadillo-type protein [Leucosporidium creatinivorum]